MDDTEEFVAAISDVTFIPRCKMTSEKRWGALCNKPADWVLRMSNQPKLYYLCDKCKNLLYPVPGWKFRRLNDDQ